jgi:general secretion pathway protein E/type IV pilus assembly protein PilB
MRVSTLPCVGGEKAVIRLLPRQNPFSCIEELGFTSHTLEIYQNWLQQPQGMIIFTGPTGSGKTSTLYTSLQTIATEHVNVVTVEDPVEYILPRITQTQVHEAAGMTFAAGLRAILRQDPDIIMVGEIRDSETAETAVRAALTGHLVLTTLHTNDAVSAIPRLKDIGPDPGLLSDALLGIVAQRLVRRVCSHCAEPYTPTEADLRVLGIDRDHAHSSQWCKGRGCARCFNSGFSGREAIIELLNVDDTIRQIIYEGTLTQLHRYLGQIEFESFRVAAIAKISQGITTVQEVLRVLPHSAMRRRHSEESRSSRIKLLNAT